MTARTILIAALALMIIYPIVMRLLLEKIHPTRLKLAALGNELLDSPHLSETQKAIVAAMLDDAFEWRVMAYLVWKSPEYAWLRLRGQRLSNGLAFIQDQHTNAKVDRFVAYFSISLAAANPFCFLVLILEFLMLAGILKCAHALDPYGGIEGAARRLVVRGEADFRHSH